MPGDLLRLVLVEIIVIQLLPEGAIGFRLDRVQTQHGGGLALSCANLVGDPPVCQIVARCLIQVFQQFALPRVPHFGAGAAHIGHGQQIQRGQMAFVRDVGGESGDHVLVAQVLFLRGSRHQQMMPDQPHNQRRVVRGDAVLMAET